jgi:hypothetical protein
MLLFPHIADALQNPTSHYIPDEHLGPVRLRHDGRLLPETHLPRRLSRPLAHSIRHSAIGIRHRHPICAGPQEGLPDR